MATRSRTSLLANDAVHIAFLGFARIGLDRKGIAVGRYVIMPDHIHLFVRGPIGFNLRQWGRMLKRALGTSAPTQAGSFWQRGFFDHLLRNGESYAQKWEYVRMNPVRAGLVAAPEDWPYQGELIPLEGPNV